MIIISKKQKTEEKRENFRQLLEKIISQWFQVWEISEILWVKTTVISWIRNKWKYFSISIKRIEELEEIIEKNFTV